MWHWFKNYRKSYPSFWETYLDSFKEQSKNSLTRLVVFDSETTGLNPKKDVILSIGAIGINNGFIKLSDIFDVFLNQKLYNPDQVAIHGILKDGNQEKIDEEEAIIKFLGYINNATLIGHHVAFDVAMINQALKRLGLPKLRNKTIDTDYLYQRLKHLPREQHTSLDALCKEFNLTQSDRHTAIGDAYITALLYLKLKAKI